MICPKCRAHHRVPAGARLVCDACGYGKGLVQERIRHGLATPEKKPPTRSVGPFPPAVNPRALVPRTWRRLVFKLFLTGFPLLFFVGWLGSALVSLAVGDTDGFRSIPLSTLAAIALGWWLVSVYGAITLRDHTTELHYAGSPSALVQWLDERLTTKGFRAEESDGRSRVYRTPWYNQFGIGSHRAVVTDREGFVELVGPRGALEAVLRGAEFE